MSLADRDPEVAAAIRSEEIRLRRELILIASENYASRAVLEATGSVLTNKYAEGYPGRRYYAGTENVDAVEYLAIERGKQLFDGVAHANVQPHSGSQANMAAYFAVLEPGDKVMGMSLDHGGHLTHGSPVNFSGRLYEFIHYGVDEASEKIDYDAVERIANATMPKLIVSGYTAYPRKIDFARFKAIADQVGALHLVDMSHIAGLIAGGAHESPVPHADIITSTTHKTLRGPRGAIALSNSKLASRIDSAVFPRMQGGPMGHAIAAKAVAFKEAMRPEFSDYASRVVRNCRELANVLEAGGLRIVSGGTDNHLMLVDLRSTKMNGSEAEDSLRRVGIVVNKNQVPFDPLPPRVTSGLRLGVAALTSRGMSEKDMHTVGDLVLEGLSAGDDTSLNSDLASRVSRFAEDFPVPGLDD